MEELNCVLLAVIHSMKSSLAVGGGGLHNALSRLDCPKSTTFVNFRGSCSGFIICSYKQNTVGFSDYAAVAVVHLVKALRFKPEGCGFDSRWCHSNFSLT